MSESPYTPTPISAVEDSEAAAPIAPRPAIAAEMVPQMDAALEED